MIAFRSVFLALLSIFFFSLAVFAQKKEEIVCKYGKISDEEVKMTSYAQDPTAEALVLYEKGYVYFKYNNDKGFQTKFEIHRRVKIFKKEALSMADIEQYLYQGRGGNKEEISDIQAFTYNWEGEKVEKTKMERSSIYTEEKDEHWTEVKFAIPNVREGSVFEYRYTVTSDYFFNLPSWHFQEGVPVLWSDYACELPEYFKYSEISQGYDPYYIYERTEHTSSFMFRYRTTPDINIRATNQDQTQFDQERIEYKSKYLRSVMKDVPAFRMDNYMSTRNDYVNKIELQLASVEMPNSAPKYYSNSWDVLAKELFQGRYGDFLRKKGSLDDQVNALTAGKTSPEDKTKAIFEFVRDNIQYNGEDGVNPIRSPKEVLAQKKGSSAEINLLLCAMLQQADIKAFPVLLSTRHHGKINPAYPSLSRLNYNLVWFEIEEGKGIMLDATSPLHGIGSIAAKTLNGQAMILINDEGKNAWVNLQNNQRNGVNTSVNLQMNSEGEWSGKANFFIQGYEALDYREKKLLKKEESPESKADEKKSGTKKWLEKAVFENLNELGQSLKASVEIKTTDHAQVNEDRIYLNPMLDFTIEENPFKAQNRKYPVDIGYLISHSFNANIEIPKGYVIEEMPKMARLSNPDGSIRFEYLVSTTGNKITLVSRLNFNRNFFMPEEYEALRGIFTQIIAKQSEQFVLKKQP
jgi:transglutaminase-like putative cysteine protease